MSEVVLCAEFFELQHSGVGVFVWQAFSVQIAQQHYNMQLKRKAWLGWHILVKKPWRVQVEQACRARAEEVCSHLSSEYEAKLAAVSQPVRG